MVRGKLKQPCEKYDFAYCAFGRWMAGKISKGSNVAQATKTLVRRRFMAFERDGRSLPRQI
jgi:hypothetical protein